MCFQRIYIHATSEVIANSKREGVLKAICFKGMYEGELEFPEGWSFKPKPSMRGVWIFKEIIHFWHCFTLLYFSFDLWISSFSVIFFQLIITSQSLGNNLKYIAGFKLFSVINTVFTYGKCFPYLSRTQKIVRLEGCALNKVQLHRSFTVFE